MIENIRIIGHRGIRGLRTENTLSSLLAATKLNIDAVELDVRVTKDSRLVICHNENLKDVYCVNKNIGDLTLQEIQQIKTPAGEPILTLKEVMEHKFDKPLVLDIKKQGTAELLYGELGETQKNYWLANSLFLEELSRLKQLYPNLEMSLQTYKHPFKTIRLAKDLGASSVTYALYLLNPLTYWQARQAGLGVWTYQNYLSFLLTWRWLARLLFVFYPSLTIITDRPDKIAPLKK